MLREIVLDDMIFAVFPLMNEGFHGPWYYDFGELIDAVDQVLEVQSTAWDTSFQINFISQGMSFCHERLVAHLVNTIAFIVYLRSNATT